MVALAAGTVDITVGAVVSAAVMNIQVSAAASALPLRSMIPVVSVTVTVAFAGSAAVGVNVHTWPPIDDASVPAMAEPLVTVKVVAVTFVTGSLNVAVIVAVLATIVAFAAGTRIVTVGGVVSVAVVNVHVTGAPERTLD